MPLWSKIAAGVVIAISLLGFAGFKAYSEYSGKRGPIVQAYGTTYYGDDGPRAPPVACKPEADIRAAIAQVHAKYDYLEGKDLQAFERRAAILRGLPPLRVDKLYVITEDDKLRDGEMVLFIGLKADCVSTVFSFPSQLYRELKSSPAA